jgi:hypothetical protein
MSDAKWGDQRGPRWKMARSDIRATNQEGRCVEGGGAVAGDFPIMAATAQCAVSIEYMIPAPRVPPTWNSVPAK